ncbi:MAG: adenylate/guanylate cyclase domain-containing protein [Spirochaetaceae bacterium]
MKIRGKIILVVLPIVFVAVIVAASAAFFLATNAVTQVMQEFLSFKVSQVERYAQSQWQLLVDNGFAGRPEMVEAAQSGVETFARSMVRTDTEVIFALNGDGEVEMTTSPFAVTPEERERLSELAEEEQRSLVTISLDGIPRVARGFSFPAFDWYVLVTERRDVFYAAVRDITYYSAIILVASAAVAVVLLWLFSDRLTRPLGRVADGMERIIQENDLSSRVEVEYSDETGRLAHTFNIMVEELDRAYSQIKRYAYDAVLAQKREHKIRNIFQKYVPQDLIDKFFQNPEQMLVGDNRELVVLFSDIRGFTTISEGMRPDDLVSSLNRYFSTQVDIIMGRNGIIDKYIGDAIMAFFGAPVSHEDDAYQAVMAGIEMAKAVERFNEEQRKIGKPEFRIGVGLAYGEVTVGNIGTDKKMDYTVIGDIVNLASRMEGLTKVYHQQLLISDRLYEAVKGQLLTRPVDRVAVKGKTQGVPIYTAVDTLEPEAEEAWKYHAASMKAYYNREFDKAARGFQAVLERLPGDYLAEVFLERATTYQASPPPPDWDGIEVMTTK